MKEKSGVDERVTRGRVLERAVGVVSAGTLLLAAMAGGFVLSLLLAVLAVGAALATLFIAGIRRLWPGHPGHRGARPRLG